MSDDLCCAGREAAERDNPRGRPELRYRIGTWSTFHEQMIGQLGRQPNSPDVDPGDATRPLAALTTRDQTDGTISLIDAWAAVCDVLAFYEERILNEGYLTTATETRSVTEIARSIGYRPDPGLAATAPLAFTIDTGVDDEVVVPLGQPVLSVPGPGELPQTFETIEELIARAEWNLLRPRRTVPHVIENGTDTLYLDGVNTGLAVGDPIVVLGAQRVLGPGSERWDLRYVAAVEAFTAPDTTAGTNHTLVTLDRGLGDAFTDPAADEIQVFTLGNRAGLFGWNAPDARMMSTEIKETAALITNTQWRDFKLADDRTREQIGSHVLDLDREYPGIVADSWVCLHGPTEVELYHVTQTNPAARTEFSLSSRVSRLFLDTDEHLDDFNRRSATVLCESRQIDVTERPDDSTVSGFDIEIDGIAPKMPVGRSIVVRGRLAADGAPTAIRTTIEAWADGAASSTMTVTTELPPLLRSTVEVLGNVATATHGAKVVDESLGHGDAVLANQRMELRRAPLTWVPGSPTGADSTLGIRVAGLPWERVTTFFDRGPGERVYTVERVIPDDPATGDDPAADVSVVTFGDGKRGARLPTGFDNVVAGYRTGIGTAGNIEAGRLTLLQERPAAVRFVDNPLPAIGGADPAAFADIRRLAPLDVMTLGRLVALQDYEDHAGSFPGVGKARAADLWDGRRSFIHLTVAEASGVVLSDSSEVATALIDSLDALKDPAHQVIVSAHTPASFAVKLRLRVEPGALYGVVAPAVEAALVDAFGFASRTFGQPVMAAEIAAVAHGVAGVQAIDLDELHRTGGSGVVEVLEAGRATWDGVAVTKAELLLIDAMAIDVSPLEDT